MKKKNKKLPVGASKKMQFAFSPYGPSSMWSEKVPLVAV